jgi:3-dehydroquinate synthase
MSPGPGADAPVVLARERVRLPGRETEIEIGTGLRHALPDVVRRLFPRAGQVAFVVDREVDRLWPLRWPRQGPRRRKVVAPPGEAAKTRAVLARLQDRLLDLRREEPVLVLGGGAVLDAAGFAAATARRGLPWVALPTTVVGMADASVGGKVAVNHPRGKNLLGTFHPPVLVLADLDTLGTLPRRDLVAGLAELYKTARIGDADLLAALRRGAPQDSATWAFALARSVAVKARLVEADERDLGARRLLNYGHTVGHALETLLGNAAMRHGEAVAVGMVVAARLAAARGLLSAAHESAQARDLAGLGLPTRLPAGARPDAVLAILGEDKKRRPGRAHTFVLPRGETALEVHEDVGEDEIRAALETASS